MKNKLFLLLIVSIIISITSFVSFAEEGNIINDIVDLGTVEENVFIPNYDVGDFIFVGTNDSLVNFREVSPKVIDGVTYVPVRYFAESLGAEVKWLEKTEEVFILLDNKSLLISTKEDNIIYSNGLIENCKSFVERDRTFVPLRAINEYFGFEVSYIPEGPVARVVNINNTVLTDNQFLARWKDQITFEKTEIYNKLNIEKEKKKEEEKKKKEEEKKKKEEEKKSNQKTIYLTFDDGPDPTYTPQILDILKKHNMKATFFMLKHSMNSNPEIVKRMVLEGHSVALHGVSHDKNKFYLDEYSPLIEMDSGNDTLESITGIRSNFIRTPYGSVPYLTKEQYNVLTSRGYKMWDWNIDSTDSHKAYQDVEKIYNVTTTSMNNLRDRNYSRIVVLFHDKKCTVDSLDMVLEYMDKNNFISKAITNDIKPMHFTIK